MSDFVSAWTTLFGVYTPVAVTDAEGAITYMIDFGYICRVAFFMLVVYCVLKLIGGVLRGNKR